MPGPARIDHNTPIPRCWINNASLSPGKERRISRVGGSWHEPPAIIGQEAWLECVKVCVRPVYYMEIHIRLPMAL